MIQVRSFTGNFYILDDGRVRQLLIVGEKEALLVDTGFPDSHVYEAVQSITDLPVQVIMTHADIDHAGGLKDFGSCRLHEADWNLEDAAALKRGELRGEKHPYLPCRSYKGKWTEFYYDK